MVPPNLYFAQYLFMRSLMIWVPGLVAKFVTTIQIWQFIIWSSILCHLGWIVFVEKNANCDFDARVFAFAVALDVSFMILFINFFLHAYVFGGGKAKYREGQRQLQKPMVVGDEQPQMSKQYKEHRATA
uniref:Elongation of very long chain fatty acids protein n=1 Tax=Globodera pallida TaxID=36090 RepID=A0A183C6G5_GLOPA